MATEGYAQFEEWATWYRVDGDLAAERAPLIALHGGPGATHEYLLPLTALAREGRAVVLYDQLGNGNSTHLPERLGDGEFWTPALFVRELANLVEHLGLERYHVLGQSWGGFLAQEYALTQPAGLRSLVLANTAASFPDWTAWHSTTCVRNPCRGFHRSFVTCRSSSTKPCLPPPFVALSVRRLLRHWYRSSNSIGIMEKESRKVASACRCVSRSATRNVR